MSQTVNVVSHAQASETSAPARKRHCPELANPSETFQSIRNEGYRTANYEVDTSVRQEEEHPRDPAILLAPVFVHTQQFSTPPPVSGNKPPSQVNQRILYRIGTAGPGSQKHAAVKLASELGRGPDWDSPLEQSISFSVQPLVKWHKTMGSIKPTDHSMKLHIGAQKDNQLLRDTVVWDVLQPYNSPQQYAAGVCECLGLRFDWYEIIVAAVDSLLADIWEECSREGSISLQRVTAADVGVKEEPLDTRPGVHSDAQQDPSCSTPEDCVMLDVEEAANAASNKREKGPVAVSIELNASNDAAKVALTVEADSSAAVSVEDNQKTTTAKQETRQEAVKVQYVPGKPLLEYTATKEAQQAWEDSKAYRVPTLVQYNVDDDPRIHWQKRMAAMRSIWAGKDAAEKKKQEEEAVARAAEAQKQAKVAQAAAQEKARSEGNAQQKADAQHAVPQQQAGTQPAAPAPQAATQPTSGPSASVPQGSTPAAAQPAANAAAAQPAPAANMAAPVQPAQPVAAASPAVAQPVQPQVRPAAPNAAVQSAAGAPAAATATASASGAAPQVSTQAPQAAQVAVETNGAATAAPGVGRAGQAAPGQTQQWQNMLHQRLHNRTKSLSQVSESASAPTAQAQASAAGAAGAPSATSNAPANTLQESITYVTQASQDQLVTAYHEMQKHLEQHQQGPGGSVQVKDEVKPEMKAEVKQENEAKVKFEAK